MTDFKFRTLRADEIECRVGTGGKDESGLSLLLYKDARCDMNILDETVGPMNWRREHSRENANCTVYIWDDDKKQWVGKEDTGTESKTESEKGLASDSFKRACVNWGIGRELYTAPFIWIKNYEFRNGRLTDRFKVASIGYDERRNINALVIVNKKKNVVFTMGPPATTSASPYKSSNAVIAAKKKSIETMCRDKGKSLKRWCQGQKIDWETIEDESTLDRMLLALMQGET